MPGFLCCDPPWRLCLALACLLSLWHTVPAIRGDAKKEKLMTYLPKAVSVNNEVKKEDDGAFLGATELPARSVDLSALNLTELVNSMLTRALKDSRKFFSLLSVTSYSSFAFHKFSVAIYNISNLKAVDPVKFPTRHCYCLNNRTNDLSDFTALLVDIIGNSTSYLTEIFKSTSILSVSQTNESDCIFICVMTGKSGRNLSDFWEMAEKSPVINYTFTSGVSAQATRRVARTSWVTVDQQAEASTPESWAQTTGEKAPGGPPWPAPSSMPPSSAGAEGPTSLWLLSGSPARPEATPSSPFRTSQTLGTQTPSPTKAPAPKYPHTGDLPAAWPFFLGELPALAPRPHVSWCPQPFLKEGTAAPPTQAIQKLNPCLMELCRFFQQCLCMSHERDPRTEATRYCLDYYSWFLKNATHICQRVKRVSRSRTLKQKCLENICRSV
ncbi:PREDICTED: HERV-H LTR-associating protein 1 [Condylura cristata]|uniref:HERV-H LTR-associating protein 1 n=1 Tax=Condylura cristata TaxID=143302 RepID=UPI0003343605|nr:PREDICTED: HERV-H LTR-associating protein 1 [Condylura cristata]